MTGCPSESEQRSYLAGELGPDEAALVRGHAEGCSSCARRLKDLVAMHEEWVRRIRSAGRSSCDRDIPDVESPPDPELIPGYRIHHEIGRGGQGVVYRALQLTTRREVALKLLREGPAASRSARRRFEREVELAAGLHHPHIVTIYESGVAPDGRLYCAMDFVEGVRLDAYFRDRRPAVETRLRLFADLCAAVNHAHQRGVIHRDLKPSNILITDEGEGRGVGIKGSRDTGFKGAECGARSPIPHSPNSSGPQSPSSSHPSPKILDFGLARQQDDGDDPHLTMTGVVAGTLPYLSPEQARGRHAEVDIRSDVYALGVILYELLTDKFPYPVTGEMADVLRHITDTLPTPPSRIRCPAAGDRRAAGIGIFPKRFPEDLETIVLKALSKDRERRYQSAGELERDIRHYLSNEPIEARRDSALYVLRKSLARHRLAVGVIAAFLVVTTSSAVGLAILYGNARRSEARAERRFNELRELARTFIFDFNGSLNNIAGTTPARELVARTGLKYLDSLAEDIDPRDIQLQAELGAAYFQLGDVQGDPQRPNLGDANGALESYLKGLGFVDAVAKSRPEDAGIQGGLGLALSRVGKLLASMQRAEEAQGYFDRAMSIYGQLAQEHPEDAQIQRDLALCRRREAGRLEAEGQIDAALEVLQEAAASSEKLARAALNDAGFRHDMASDHSVIGRILMGLGRLNDALDHLESARDTLDELVRENPHDAVITNDAATIHDQVGRVLQMMNRPGDALVEFRRSLALAESVMAADSHFSAGRVAIQRSLCRIGEIELSLGQIEEAAHAFERHRDISEAIVRDNPTPSAWRELAVSHYKAADLARAHGQLPDVDDETRVEAQIEARNELKDCRDIFLKLRDEGQLAPADQDVPEEIAQEMAACEQTVLSLNGKASSNDANAQN